MSRSPFQRHIQIRYLNDGESGEEFFRFGIRAIVNLSLPVAHGNCRRRLRRLQSRPADKNACGLKSLTVGLPGRNIGRLSLAEVFL
jgi:hypothetical protein